MYACTGCAWCFKRCCVLAHAAPPMRPLSCRLMSSELKLYHYSLEACVAAVMRRRVPHVSQAVMATWFNAGHAGAWAGAVVFCGL